ncbi:thymidylate synthase [Nostoc phage A1]|nr:thymidylate synthase [Nostoc phage A1]
MQVRLIARTTGVENTEYHGKTIDEIITGIARISSSREVNNLFEEPHKLLRHCIINGHWSVFTESNLIFEIVTSRAIGRELLRHWSIRPQEFSQRYAEITKFEEVEIRKQSKNNRQSSTEIFDPIIVSNERLDIQIKASDLINDVLELCENNYKLLLNAGVARESARYILPETTETRLIMNGTIREWITTLNQRLHQTAQKECRMIAEAIRDFLLVECPIISKALYNFEDAYDIHILDRVTLEKFGVYEMVKANNFKKIK